ncbi:hypothetical protein CDD82_3117 [Ophiocordyceps australis]|uniref:Uncharacterized protein n=1 Tax=Ophiocordyceps australis TaxID=1399860 RepID=A0A2C5X6S3_9HYPO|nr:hypothetical protein CDD82_3117 [Ophiocordyceps australis]
MERHIHVDAHLHLFRHIAVEAEHNRFSDSTRTAMANAIRVFMPRSEAPAVGEKRKGRDGEEAVQPNLRTLTIRVAPRWVSPVVLEQDDAADESDSNEMSLIAFGPNVSDHDGEDDGEHGSDGGQDSNSIDAQDTSGVQPSHFTFVDFFAQDSPVVEAIKAVVSRFVRIELMSQFQVGSSTKLGCCMTMDRYYQVPIKPHTDPWRRDIQMRRQRRLKEAAFGIAMQNLGESVSRFCANHFQAKTSGVAAVSGWHGFHESSSDYED